MMIERTRIDGEPVRRFHLLVEVTFADRPAEDEPGRNYYQDRELADVAKGWMRDGLEDRDDSPAVRFTEFNAPHTFAYSEQVEELERLKIRQTRLTKLVWQWVINANNGNGADIGDLMNALEGAGYPCPAELEDES